MHIHGDLKGSSSLQGFARLHLPSSASTGSSGESGMSRGRFQPCENSGDKFSCHMKYTRVKSRQEEQM